MRSLLDDLLDQLSPDHGNIKEVCLAIASAVRENPEGTRMWATMIETRITQHKLPLIVGRALLEAMEVFDSEKTMWLAPNGADKTSRVANSPPTPVTSKIDTESNRNDAASAAASVRDVEPIPSAAQRMRAAAALRRTAGVGSIVNNRYLLDSKLGNGCMGQVFIATDLAAETTGVKNSKIILEVVAVDLQQQTEALLALRDAVARTKRLTHPNIVKVFGVEQADGQVSIAMECMSGRWLGDIIKQARKEPLAQATAWSLIEGISNGLAYAHKHGMVHSNLNPCSIFVTDAGTPKIMGFELIEALPASSDANELLDTMTLRAYSEAYTADLAVVRSNARPADDLYPLGVIAYELLTGRHPFQRCSLEVARQKGLHYEPIADLPPRAAKLIDDCLSFERAARPEDAARFIKRMQGPTVLRWMFGNKYSALGAQPAGARSI